LTVFSAILKIQIPLNIKTGSQKATKIMILNRRTDFLNQKLYPVLSFI